MKGLYQHARLNVHWDALESGDNDDVVLSTVSKIKEPYFQTSRSLMGHAEHECITTDHYNQRVRSSSPRVPCPEGVLSE